MGTLNTQSIAHSFRCSVDIRPKKPDGLKLSWWACRTLNRYIYSENKEHFTKSVSTSCPPAWPLAGSIKANPSTGIYGQCTFIFCPFLHCTCSKSRLQVKDRPMHAELKSNKKPEQHQGVKLSSCLCPCLDNVQQRPELTLTFSLLT